MSLLWPDKLYITIRPDKVEFVRRSAGLRSKMLDRAEIDCEVLNGRPNWASPLNVVKARLHAIDAKCEVTISLSNHFVRYTLVPWSKDLINDAERVALARIRFDQIYGDLSKSWSIRISSSGYGQPFLASAVDQDLIDAVRGSFTHPKVTLASIQPWLMTALNQSRKYLKSKDFRIVLAEPGQVCILYFSGGAYAEIKSQAIGPKLSEQLNLVMERESVISSSASHPRPYLLVSGFPVAEITPEISRKFEMLPQTLFGEKPKQTGVFATAVGVVSR